VGYFDYGMMKSHSLRVSGQIEYKVQLRGTPLGVDLNRYGLDDGARGVNPVVKDLHFHGRVLRW
jgi:hypothetical protein